MGTVAVSGIVAALVGLGGALLSMSPLLESRLTFVNPNHLAGFLNLTSFSALGFALRSRGQARALWMLGFAVAGAGVFLSLSRGGIGAFFVGASIFALLYIRQIREEQHRPGFLRYAAVPSSVALALAITSYLALDHVVAEIRTVTGAANEVKLALVPIGADLVRRFPLTGIGRGAFETVFAAYKVEPETVTFTHLENEWLQPLIDLGLPVGMLLVAAIAWTWFRAACARNLSRPEIGALAGSAALVAQNTVDFSLELLGVALPFAVVLGVLARSQPSLRLRPAVIRVSAVAFLALGAAGMALWFRHPTEVDAGRVALARGPDEAVALACEATLAHPADYLPQALAGARLVQASRCAEGLPWLNRAMSMNPTAAEPHRYAARCLAGAGQDSLAKREYRLASLFGDPAALAEGMHHYPALEDLFTIAPETPQGLISLAALLSADRPTDAAVVLQRAWNEYGDLPALRWLSSLTLQLGNADRALSLAAHFRDLQPLDPTGWVVGSSALSKLGRPEEAQRLLEEGAARVPGQPAILGLLAQRAVEQRRFSEARRLVESMQAHTAPEVASKRLQVASIFWAQGRFSEALAEARSAAGAVPSDPGPLTAVSNYSAAMARYDEAISALEAAAALPGVHAGLYEKRLTELRAARQAQADQQMLQRGTLPR